MFVGETGVDRIVARTAELMKQDPNEDARAQGGIDLPTIQRYINYWFSSSMDLFGGEISSNAAEYFASGLKGREREEQYDDHVALRDTYVLPVIQEGRIQARDVPMRNAMNEVLRDAWVKDNQRAVDRWNKVIADAGLSFRFTLPSKRFNRRMGIYSGMHFNPQGEQITDTEFHARHTEWLPSDADKAWVRNLMNPVLERGKMAHWIGAPARGINGQPIDFEYIRRA